MSTNVKYKSIDHMAVGSLAVRSEIANAQHNNCLLQRNNVLVCKSTHHTRTYTRDSGKKL